MWLGRRKAGQRGPRRQKRGCAAWEAWSKRACGSELAWRLVRGASGVNGRRAGGVYRCWAAETERDHRHEQAVPECDVPSNGT
jgi:hypothetical protein